MYQFVCFQLVIFTCVCYIESSYMNSRDLKILYTWTALDFKYPSDAARDEAIANGTFNAKTLYPIDVDIYAGE